MWRTYLIADMAGERVERIYAPTLTVAFALARRGPLSDCLTIICLGSDEGNTMSKVIERA